MASQTEQSRALGLRFVEIGTTRQLTTLAEIIHPDTKWRIAIDKDMAGGYGGDKLASELYPEATAHYSHFDDFSFKTQKMVVEGNHVFIDVVCEGSGPGTVKYYQNYAFFLTTSGDQITDVKVWSDPFQVKSWIEQIGKYQAAQQ